MSSEAVKVKKIIYKKKTWMINQKFLSLLRSHQIQSIEKTESTKKHRNATT